MTSLVTKSCLEPRLPVEDTTPRQSLSQFCLQTPDVFKEKVEVGEGTFGKVYKAKINNTLYALKKIKMES
jgi:serine/threonine protein kinase